MQVGQQTLPSLTLHTSFPWGPPISYEPTNCFQFDCFGGNSSISTRNLAIVFPNSPICIHSLFPTCPASPYLHYTALSQSEPFCRWLVPCLPPPGGTLQAVACSTVTRLRMLRFSDCQSMCSCKKSDIVILRQIGRGLQKLRF